MKKTFLALSMVAAVAGLATNVRAQGTLWLNNYDSGSGVFLNGNTSAAVGTFVQVLAGVDASSLSPVFASGGTYNGLSTFTLTDNSGGTGGSFFDANYGVVPTVAPSGTAFIEVITWSGAASYAAALTTPGAFSGASSIFSETLGTAVPPPPNAPTPNTLNLPAGIHEVITPVPEPSTIALAGLGSLAALMFRRKK